MNILFTTSAVPKIFPFLGFEQRPPLGLGTLISLARNDGHNVFFIDNFLKPSSFIEEGFIQKNNIDFIAISANTMCYHDSLRMFNKIQRLREKKISKAKIIVGGPQTSIAPDSIPDFVDYVVQGEGEEAILDIINGNIKQRVIKKNRLKNLDSLPFQPWDVFLQQPYSYHDKEPVFTLLTSRGCLRECSFCSVSSIWGKLYTYFSPDRIISEIDHLINNYGAKGIFFREDDFTLNTKRTVEFCEKVIQKKMDFFWGCETRADTLCNEELVKLMHASGCRSVYLGVESGSQKILDILCKNISLEQIEQAVKLCKKYNIKTYCSFITGVPGETYEDYLLTKRLINRLEPYRYLINVYVGVPGSPLYRYVLENNMYEYIDDLGVLYVPGFGIKTKFFYRKENKRFSNYAPNQITDYDKKLLRELRIEKFNRIASSLNRKLSNWPDPVRIIKNIRKMILEILFKIIVR